MSSSDFVLIFSTKGEDFLANILKRVFMFSTFVVLEPLGSIYIQQS